VFVEESVTDGERSRTNLAIAVYLVLTFALSSYFYWKLTHIVPGMKQGPLFLGLMWCPGVSGLLTRFMFQRNLRGHGFAWGKTKYQLASVWIPLVYASAVYLPVWAAGYFDPQGAPLLAFERKLPHVPHPAVLVILFLVLATAGVLSSCVSALGEELGWRGFLVPQLAKVMPYTKVSLVSGVIWASWHVPVILGGDYHGAGPLWYSVTCFAVLVVGVSFLFAWMRLKSGSMWTGMFLHASHNCLIQVFFDPQTRHARLTDLWTTEFGAGLALAGIAVAIIFYRKRGELPAGGDALTQA
jgi:uncharacterized protein